MIISCPECAKQVSDQASVCIHCGYPVQKKAEEAAAADAASAAAALHPYRERKRLLEGNANYDQEAWAQGAMPAGSAPPSAGAGQPMIVKTAKSRGVYVILGLFFGLLGIHNFYAGYFGRGVAQLLLVLILGWFVVGIVIVAVWVLVELFVVKTDGAGDAFA